MKPSEDSHMLPRYNAEIVAGALLPEESRTIAKLIIDGVTEAELDRLLRVENVLQKRSPGTAIRKAALIRKRFDLVDCELLVLVAEGSRNILVQSLLVAAIRHSKLIGDFLQQVVKEKWRLFETELKSTDWENFLLQCEYVDPNVSKWKESTRAKLGQVVKKCLAEAGYLDRARNSTITPVTLRPEIRQYLVKNDDYYLLNSMDILS